MDDQSRVTSTSPAITSPPLLIGGNDESRNARIWGGVRNNALCNVVTHTLGGAVMGAVVTSAYVGAREFSRGVDGESGFEVGVAAAGGAVLGGIYGLGSYLVQAVRNYCSCPSSSNSFTLPQGVQSGVSNVAYDNSGETQEVTINVSQP